MRPVPAVLTASILLALAGCGAAGPADAPVVRDSAGVRIVENRMPGERVAFRLEAEPEVSIGALDGPAEYTFEGVKGGARLEDGRLVIADGSELKFYDAAGRHLMTAGGAGEGPGEFSFLNAVVPCGGEIFAGDMRQEYLTVFDREGTFVETRPIPSSGNPVFAMTLVACDAATGLPLLRAPSPFSPSDPAGMSVGTVAIVRAATGADTRVDTVAAVPALRRSGGFPGPFDPATRYAYDGANIHVMDTDAIVIRTFGVDGALRRIARVPHAPRPVSTEEQSRAVEERLADMPDAFAARLRSQLEAAPKPDQMPAAGAIAADAAGRLWVQPFTAPWEDPATGWLVLDADGAFLGTAELPSGFRPLDIGEDWILGVWQDELDVAYVRLYRFGSG